MATIQCKSIEKPVTAFLCEVVRPESAMRYIRFDGTMKPLQSKRKEIWTVLAETIDGARKIADYHFYMSEILSISQATTP